MTSVNRGILVGRYAPSGPHRYLYSPAPQSGLSSGISDRRTGLNTGETIEDTQWHCVTFYDRLAEIAGEYVKKGRPIYVEGRLKYGKYTGQDCIEKNTVDIIATGSVKRMAVIHRNSKQRGVASKSTGGRFCPTGNSRVIHSLTP